MLFFRNMPKPRVKIRENSLLARFAAYKLQTDHVAIVWGNTIHLYRTSISTFLNNTSWLAHELKHVEQFRRLGVWRFAIQYFKEYLRHGYFDNHFEEEARAAEAFPEIIERFDLTKYKKYFS